jgi:four helix bundle protein
MGEGFRNLIAWQKAYKFVLEVYVATKSFPKDELYCLTSQTRRAVISVLANIAEGYERQSRKNMFGS